MILHESSKDSWVEYTPFLMLVLGDFDLVQSNPIVKAPSESEVQSFAQHLEESYNDQVCAERIQLFSIHFFILNRFLYSFTLTL